MIDHISCAAFYRLIAVHAVATQVKPRIVDFESTIEAGSGAVQRIENQ